MHKNADILDKDVADSNCLRAEAVGSVETSLVLGGVIPHDRQAVAPAPILSRECQPRVAPGFLDLSRRTLLAGCDGAG